MLTPVHISGATASQFTSPLSAQSQAKSVAVATKLALAWKGADPEQLSRYTAKLASLLIAFKDGSHTTLETLTLAVAKALDFEQKPGETLEDFGKRLADFILAMKPSETLDADAKTILRTLNVPIRAFAEALKDPSSPVTARLVVQAETALESALQSTEEIATHSYQHDGRTDKPQTDSLKYRASAPQAALLSEALEKQIEKPLTTISAKLSDIRTMQQQLVKAFVGDLTEPLLTPAPHSVADGTQATEIKQASLASQPAQEPALKSPGSEAQVSSKSLGELSEKGNQTTTDATAHKYTESGKAQVTGQKVQMLVSPNAPLDNEPKLDIRDEPQLRTAPVRERSESTTRTPEAPAKPGLLAAVAERLARAAGLMPKMTEQDLSEAILKAAMDIVTEEKAATSTKHGTTLQQEQRTEEPPLQTTHLLKDMSSATANKLQLVAQALILKENVESVLANLSPKSAKPEVLIPLPATVDDLTSMTTDVPESQIKAARIAASEIKQLPTPTAPDMSGPIKAAHVETQKDVQLVANRIPASHLPAEQVAQQLLTNELMAFQQIPYPISKSKMPVTLNPEEETEEQRNGEASEDRQSEGDAAKDEQNEKPGTEATVNEDPFAADVALKRHASDAERAFHMYQKMGGF